MLWLPGVARDDSNEVLKRVFSLKFSLMNKVCWDSQTSLTLFTHPIPRQGGGTGSKKTKNLPALEDHLRAKFHRNPSSGSDFYREHTYTQTNIVLYLVED